MTRQERAYGWRGLDQNDFSLLGTFAGRAAEQTQHGVLERTSSAAAFPI